MCIRTVRRCVLAAATAGLLALAGVGLGQAQPPGDDPVEVEPPGLVSAVATCAAGTAEVTVYVDSNEDPPLQVRLDQLRPSTGSQSKGTVLDEEHGVHTVTFTPVAAGDYEVHVDDAGFAGPANGIPVQVKPCGQIEPPGEPLTVEVECQAGWGIATFQVANPTTGEVSGFTLLINDLEAYVDIELSPGVFLRITENRYEDGSHTATLTGPGFEATKEFTVACESGNAPRLDVGSTCTGSTGKVDVELLNPNRRPVDYEVKLGEHKESLTVSGGERGAVSFAELPDGEHRVLVTGSDQTETAATLTLDCDTTTTTTTTTSTTTSTPTETSTATSTTTPVPQGRDDSGLARTGTAVGQMVGFGALALLLGGALLVIARRRRARRS